MNKAYEMVTSRETARFTARVLSCEPDGRGRYLVALNESRFYPEGGGQPADAGTLGTARVLDVHEREGRVTHTVDAPLEAGASVEGEIDWPRRFDHMQQHSGEHVVSGIVHALTGYDNVGFHMGALVTVDFSGELGPGELAEVERRANEAIWADLPVRVEYPAPEVLAGLQYRSKKALSGEVRIVSIPGVDVCACCGTHVARTGQIGLIRLTDAQRYKGGTRVTLLSGRRAWEDYAAKDGALGRAGALLSVKPGEVPGAVERALGEAARLRQEAAALRRETLAFRARELGRREGNLCVVEDNLPPEALREFALMLREQVTGIAAVYSQGRYAIASATQDVREAAKAMNAALSGRGGGSKELAQGTVACSREEIERYWGK